MPDTVITVQGSFGSLAPPERVTVALTVGHEGSDKGKIYDLTTTSAHRVSAALAELHDADRGPVTWWSSGQLRTWLARPWSNGDTELPLVFHAVVDLKATFADFGALARFLDDVTPLPGVAVGGLTWTLTEATKKALTVRARQAAVQDAAARAGEYAAALDLHTVTAVAVADVGMLGDRVGSVGTDDDVMYARIESGGDGDDSEGIDLTPGDVRISAQVDARFVAS